MMHNELIDAASLFRYLANRFHSVCDRFVEKRGISKFVSKAIEKALEEEKNTLKAAFREAENDPDTKKTIAEWSALGGEDWDALFS
jgi:hypothetical protein